MPSTTEQTRMLSTIINDTFYLMYRKKRKDIKPFHYAGYRQLRALMGHKGCFIGMFAFIFMAFYYWDKQYESTEEFNKRRRSIMEAAALLSPTHFR